MKTVMMTGGKGTRLASVTKDIPRPMVPIKGISILEREIRYLKEQDFNEIYGQDMTVRSLMEFTEKMGS